MSLSITNVGVSAGVLTACELQGKNNLHQSSTVPPLVLVQLLLFVKMEEMTMACLGRG